MDERLRSETEKLTRSWMQHDQRMLRTYLVAGVEDPRINVQSVLSRHFLIVALFDERFQSLIEHELRFAIVMNWAQEVLEQSAGVEDLNALRHALKVGADDAEGVPVPRFASETFKSLPAAVGDVTIPNYLGDLLDGQPMRGPFAVPGGILATFEHVWSTVLANERPSPVSVVEPACGSANDYRFLDSFGLARLIEYAGFDLCETNLANARSMFPRACFQTGNVFEIQAPDRAFDYCVVHDLFEHLSIEGMERALSEIGRITRRGLALGLFNAHEGDDHIVRPTDEYHWNTLSVPKVRLQLERLGFQPQIIHIDTFLKWRFGCDRTHNKGAYTIFAERATGGF
jgi:hypothetical protein